MAATQQQDHVSLTRERAAQALSRASRVVVMSGAGMSAESGINTFRDPEVGVWKNKLALMWFGTPYGWNWTPGLSWKAYRRFWQPIGRAQPNEGHRAVANMSSQLGVPPVAVITQNVDHLHQRAGTPDDKVFEVHGSVFRHRCIKCGVVAEGLDMSTWVDTWPTDNPKCASCGGGLRPDAVLFGETLPDEAWGSSVQAMRSLQADDVLLVIGTSGSVYPAASLPELARETPGVCIIEINPDITGISRLVNIHVTEPSAQCLPFILTRATEIKHLRQQQQQQEQEHV